MRQVLQPGYFSFVRNAKLYGDVTITWCFNGQKLKPPLVLFAACAPCCLCSGSRRSSRSLSCTWLAACANSTSRNGPTSSLHAAGGSSLSRTFQWSYLKVLSIKTFHLKPLPLYFFFFLSLPKKTCLCLPDICHQILDLYSQGNKPIPQQMQEKERAPAAPISAPPAPQGQPPAANPPPPPPKKTSPQGGSPSRQLKRSHVSIHSACAVQLVFNMIHARGSYFISSVLQTSPKDEPKAPGNMFIND